MTVARPTDTLLDLVQRMSGGRDRRAVVLNDDNRPIGILSPTDLNRAV